KLPSPASKRPRRMRSAPPVTSGWRRLPRASRRGSTRRLPSSGGCSNRRHEMGQVLVKVNGRDFALSCADGQEPRIRRLAQYVDAKIGDFTKTIGQVGEARLILLAALVIADELSDANEALVQERGRTAAGATAAEPGEAAAS